jgi:hypothetical protein
MAEIKVGDKVLFAGKVLDVMDISDETGRLLALVADLEIYKVREAAKAEVLRLRQEGRAAQAAHREAGGAGLHPKVMENNAKTRAISDETPSLAGVRLRVDLLEHWPEKSMWLHPPRALSDTQQYVAMLPSAKGGLGLRGGFSQKMAYLMLEQMGLDDEAVERIFNENVGV